MFSHEGPTRSVRQNAVLAWYLALVAGFVNSGGFVLIDSFTSHVTGHVGRSSIDLATGHGDAAFFASLLTASFFGGAFFASLLVETIGSEHRGRAYGLAFSIEAGLLAAFILVAGLSHATHPRALDAEASILCIAMGMQNSLVTRLSGAIVRTTHLTGIVTDLAIESARWYRWHTSKLLGQPEDPATRPSGDKTRLLLIIILAFILGSGIGGVMTLRASRWAMLAPGVAIALAAVFAFRSQNRSPATPAE